VPIIDSVTYRGEAKSFSRHFPPDNLPKMAPCLSPELLFGRQSYVVRSALLLVSPLIFAPRCPQGTGVKLVWAKGSSKIATGQSRPKATVIPYFDYTYVSI
jgi:hypothetical protein